MNTAEKLKKLRENHGLSQEQFAKIIGVDRTTIVKYETGASRPTRYLKKIAHYFNVTTDYLLGNDEDDITKADLVERRQTTTFPIRTAAMVPIIGSVRCGPGGPAYEYIDEYVSIDDSYRKPDEIRGFRATGDSMEGDEIHDGDLCLVHLQDEVEDGALAVVVIDGEEGTLKRIRRQPGMIILEASNPAYQTRVFAGEAANTIRIIGKVVEVRHKK